MREFDKVLSRVGVSIPKTAKILDYGCGAGETVRALRQQGYVNAVGYDLDADYSLRDPSESAEYIHLGSPLNLRLPYDDNTFDLVISDQVFEHVLDQVAVFRELYRVMRPGGVALHVIPARYRVIEGHTFVPFGNLFPHRWYQKFWALLGVRNSFQKGLSADETANHNVYFYIAATHYVPTSTYKVVWPKIGFDYRFVTQEYFDAHRRGVMRFAGKLNRALPLGALYRIVQSRHVLLTKPSIAVTSRSQPVDGDACALPSVNTQ